MGSIVIGEGTTRRGFAEIELNYKYNKGKIGIDSQGAAWGSLNGKLLRGNIRVGRILAKPT